MAIRDIVMVVTNKKVGYSYLKSCQNPGDIGRYLVPTYQMDLYVVEYCENQVLQKRKVGAFEVIRFGIDYDENKDRTYVCGLATEQLHRINTWYGSYRPRSNPEADRGAWIVKGDYLVHDGPDNPQIYPAQLAKAFGALGCIEVCGPGQWKALNDLILKESCLKSFEEVARSGRLSIKYQGARYPGLFTDKNKFMQQEFGGKQPPGLSSDLWGRAACSGSSGACNLTDPCCELPPQPADEPPPRRDPLTLNLDGNGIKTVGIDAGIYFDHDANGFQELTGWIAPGNGVLMLDVDGDGSLGAGRELFGDAMTLPNGMRVANGFQALAHYDANGDGKIDANDPIWSQLKVWHYGDYAEDAL